MPTKVGYSRWYDLALWRRRRHGQLLQQPLCRMCAAAGKTERATVVDHVTPHRGVWELFATASCKACVKAVTRRANRASSAAASTAALTSAAHATKWGGRSIGRIRRTSSYARNRPPSAAREPPVTRYGPRTTAPSSRFNDVPGLITYFGAFLACFRAFLACFGRKFLISAFSEQINLSARSGRSAPIRVWRNQ